MNKVKGLRIHVYRWSLGDCSMEGISSRYDSLILIGPGIDGPEVVDLDEPAENVVMLVKRRLFGTEEHLHLEPLDGHYAVGSKWYMSGGNFGYSCDSRFPAKYPLSIHDRYEG